MQDATTVLHIDLLRIGFSATVPAMPLMPEHSALAYLVVGLIAIYRLPSWGRGVLGFLRDLEDFRASRWRRRPAERSLGDEYRDVEAPD